MLNAARSLHVNAGLPGGCGIFSIDLCGSALQCHEGRYGGVASGCRCYAKGTDVGMVCILMNACTVWKLGMSISVQKRLRICHPSVADADVVGKYKCR